jgi:phosphate:Na+ symporter
MENTAQSIETSSLHLDMISDLKRINSHICSIAYPILEQAGVLAKTRLKEPPTQPAPIAPEPDPAIDEDGWKKRKPRPA